MVGFFEQDNKFWDSLKGKEYLASQMYYALCCYDNMSNVRINKWQVVHTAVWSLLLFIVVSTMQRKRKA